MIDRRSRLEGAVWGHLAGDAMGVPYESLAPGEIGEVVWGRRGTHGQPPGTWSDDGALMLALLDSLLAVGFDVEDQARRMLDWADGGAYTPDGDGRFDIGGTTAAALDRIRRGEPAATAGGTGERNLGNGSLMRILPVALVGNDLADDPLAARSFRASAVTHRHTLAQVTCALYVLLARRLLDGSTDRETALADARASLRQLFWQLEPPEMLIHEAALDRLERWAERHGSGFVIDAFWSAWDAFATADSYEATIDRAVRYGHDTDTTAAIAGGLAGLWWGTESIPADWRAGMRGRAIVDELTRRLVNA